MLAHTCVRHRPEQIVSPVVQGPQETRGGRGQENVPRHDMCASDSARDLARTLKNCLTDDYESFCLQLFRVRQSSTHGKSLLESSV